MTHASRSFILLSAQLACCGCQRVDEPARIAGEAARGVPATLAGEVTLAGELAHASGGALTLYAWAEGAAGREGSQPYLSRTYVIGDPDWTQGEGTLTHYFGLCDADRVGDDARALPEELEIEACFDPDGLHATRGGVVRGSAHARNGAKDVRITVAPQTATAQPPGVRKKDG